VLKPFAADTEVSNAVSHDPEIRHVSDGRPNPGDIVYTGLSADAVDELMNHDSSGDNSAIPMLNAYAEANGIDPRDMYLNWYDNLTHDQRKALPEAGFGVDPDEFGNYPQGVTDGSIIEGWSQGWSTRQQFGEAGGVSNEQYDAVIDYTSDHSLYREDDPDTPQLEGDGYTTYDPQAIKVMLGIEPPASGQSAPSQEVIIASRAIIADELYGDLDRGFRPQTIDEFKFWTEIHDYPALPAAACEPLPAKPVPREPVVPVATDPPPPIELQPQPQPPECGHEYIVQSGDTLWDIAGRSSEQLDVLQLMAYHNSHNPENRIDFDPQRADRNFFTTHDPADDRRDPDLIQPGEVIYVDCVDDIAPRLPNTA
jgi:LysM domain